MKTVNSVSTALLKICSKTSIAARKNRYSICLVLSATASLLSIATPLLTALIVKNIINNFNMKGIVPTLFAMVLIKGTRSLLRGRVNRLLLEVSPQTLLARIRERVSSRLKFLENIDKNEDFFSKFITRVTGGVKLKVSAAAASLITDAVNIILSGAVFYFSESYILSVLISFVIPTCFVVPLFNKQKTKKITEPQN